MTPNGMTKVTAVVALCAALEVEGITCATAAKRSSGAAQGTTEIMPDAEGTLEIMPDAEGTGEIMPVAPSSP